MARRVYFSAGRKIARSHLKITAAASKKIRGAKDVEKEQEKQGDGDYMHDEFGASGERSLGFQGEADSCRVLALSDSGF